MRSCSVSFMRWGGLRRFRTHGHPFPSDGRRAGDEGCPSSARCVHLRSFSELRFSAGRAPGPHGTEIRQRPATMRVATAQGEPEPCQPTRPGHFACEFPELSVKPLPTGAPGARLSPGASPSDASTRDTRVPNLNRLMHSSRGFIARSGHLEWQAKGFHPHRVYP